MRRLICVLVVLGMAVMAWTGAMADSAEVIVLHGADAVLDAMPYGVIEEGRRPYSVGGWRMESVVGFPLSVPEAGYYAVVLRYSKEGMEGPVDVRIWADHSEDYVAQQLLPTGAPGDWTAYADFRMGLLYLSPEDTMLYVGADDPSVIMGHMINLEEITLSIGSTTTTIHARNALLDDAPGAVIQQDAPVPVHVGGWTDGSTLRLPVSVAHEGIYEVALRYSREGSSPDPVSITVRDATHGPAVDAYIWPTGDALDWSHYVSVYLGDLYLEPSTEWIEVAQTDPDGLPSDHLMNLQQITLRPYLVAESGAAIYRLGSQDADLSEAPGVGPGQDAQNPFNLGFWGHEDAVRFPLDIEREADYDVILRYSKDGTETWVDMELTTGDEAVVEATVFATAYEEGDWSHYEDAIFCLGLHLTPDTGWIQLTRQESSGDGYVVNLQRIVLIERE